MLTLFHGQCLALWQNCELQPHNLLLTPLFRFPSKGGGQVGKQICIYLCSFLTSTLEGGGVVVNVMPRPLNPQVRAQVNPMTGLHGSGKQRPVCMDLENRKPLAPHRSSNPGPPIRKYADYSFPVSKFQRTSTPNRPKYNKIPNTVRPETISTNPVRQISIFCAFWLYRPLVIP